ncbi:unnamed protein product, partial [Prorocentrum cordatum]
MVLPSNGGDDTKKEFVRQVRRRETDGGAQSAQKSCAGIGPRSKSLHVLMMKMLLSFAQSHRNIEGVLFDVRIAPADPPEVLEMQEQGSAYNAQAQAKGKGHGFGAPHVHVFEGLL